MAIRKGEIDDVRAMLERDPDLVHVTATTPPKKDAGQQPLQVALKSGRLDVATLLLDGGADVNFQEAAGSSPWTAPVLHDAVRCAVMSSRWTIQSGFGPQVTFEDANSPEVSDSAYGLLRRVLEAGADPAAHDSFGNSALQVACLQGQQILPRVSDENPKPISRNVVGDLWRIFNALYAHGADPTEPIRHDPGQTVADWYAEAPIGQFLRPR